MLTTFKTAVLFVFLTNFIHAQESISTSDSREYSYTFNIESISSQTDEATIKYIKVYSKDLFEAHPNFDNGTFNVVTTFPVPEDRVREYLQSYGYMILDFEVSMNHGHNEIKSTQQ